MNNLADALKNKGLKLTEARLALYECLKESPKALSPKDIFKSIKDKTDLASIYRNLALFEEMHLVHAITHGHYALCEHSRHQNHGSHDHIHVIILCQSCEKTEEIKNHTEEVCEAANHLAKLAKPLKTTQSILLQGYCSSCS